MSDITERIFSIIKSMGGLNGVEIVAASKTRTIDEILDAVQNTPVAAAAENRAQELVEKYDGRIDWDFIGQLQTNKVKYIIDKTRIIHSVDRMSLAIAIDSAASRCGKVQDVLIQLNAGREPSKGGVFFGEVAALADKLSALKNIRLRGLTAMTPLDATSKEQRSYFDGAYKEFSALKAVFPATVKYLSMGMSGDNLIAVEAGANLIRLGRAIFGERR